MKVVLHNMSSSLNRLAFNSVVSNLCRFTLKIEGGGQEFALVVSSSVSRVIERAMWSGQSEQCAVCRAQRRMWSGRSSHSSGAEINANLKSRSCTARPAWPSFHLFILSSSSASYLCSCQPLQACASSAKYFPSILRQYLPITRQGYPMQCNAIQQYLVMLDNATPYNSVLYTGIWYWYFAKTWSCAFVFQRPLI